jgi:hypothetical protein
VALVLAGCGGASILSGADEDSQPAGRVFGFITGADPEARTIEFDAAEWLTGKEAIAAAVADGKGQPGEPPPNDYYIRNPERKAVVLGVADDARIRGAAPVTVLRPRPLCESCPSYPLSVDEFFAAWKGGLRPGQGSFWVTTRGGKVVAIDEQYRP